MSVETRAYDNDHGDPIVVLVATGTHDVSRLVHLLAGATPNTEQRRLGQQVLRQVRRHNAGRAALALLRDHGGPDFTTDPADPDALDVAERRAAADLHALARAGERLQAQPAPGCACPADAHKGCGWRAGIGALVDEIHRRARRRPPVDVPEVDLAELRLAVADPGAFLPRGDRYHEPLTGWQARAVVAAGWRPTTTAVRR